MPKRLLGVLAIIFVALAAFAGTASAVEGGEAPAEDHGSPTIDEIGQRNEITEQFFPEAAEPPPWTQWLYYPLLVVGILAAALLLLRYLQWQPRFAQERRNRRRR